MISALLGFCIIYSFLISLALKFTNLKKLNFFFIFYFVLILLIVIYVFVLKKNFFDFWIIFNYFNFFVCCIVWLYGLIEKSFSVNILRYMHKNQNAVSQSTIVKNSILPMICQRIKLLEKSQDLIIKDRIYISKKGQNNAKKIIKIRKFFKIKDTLLYKLK